MSTGSSAVERTPARDGLDERPRARLTFLFLVEVDRLGECPASVASRRGGSPRERRGTLLAPRTEATALAEHSDEPIHLGHTVHLVLPLPLGPRPRPATGPGSAVGGAGQCGEGCAGDVGQGLLARAPASPRASMPAQYGEHRRSRLSRIRDRGDVAVAPAGRGAALKGRLQRIEGRARPLGHRLVVFSARRPPWPAGIRGGPRPPTCARSPPPPRTRGRTAGRRRPRRHRAVRLPRRCCEPAAAP
ncbi:hypothetical protein RKD29_007590 [Streptomyces tendae]